MNVDLFAEKWIIDSNFILRENTAETQILAKMRRNQPAAELRSQVEIYVATGMLSCQPFQVTTSTNSALKKKKKT